MGTLEKYQQDVNFVFEKYMQMFADEYPNEKTILTAQEFLSKHNDAYRAEVNNIAILCIRNNNFVKEVHDKLLELLDQDTARLHKNLMELA